ncbi:late competence development ComFB family protein [Hydrogenoanaerobacterium sp.]|uniref:late competence development ComFB family protein n=1 Tax=Hydrogenoanaerobacterium sp. TaxID=2953763 RepID=UPI00289FE6FF|nr:late competence development ComFB family protein [Hydrogenoanaerobacterium sp.]
MARSKKEIDKDAMYRKIMPSSIKAAAPEATSLQAAPAPEEATPIGSLYKSGIDAQMKEQGENTLINLMEGLVFSKLEAALERFSCCKCDKCKKDIVAIALNKLPSKYVVINEKNKAVLSLVEQQHSTEVTTALVQAILVVKANPRH